MTSLINRPDVTTVLWDLDGTLVRMHRAPFRVLMPLLACAAFADVVPPWRVPSAVRTIVTRIRTNEGAGSNHELLRELVAAHTGCDSAVVDSRLNWLSTTGFPLLRWCFRPRPGAPQLVADLAERGLSQVVATNPLWPRQTVVDRLSWGGVDIGHFDYITAGENMTRSKPRTGYYRELLSKLGARPQQCVMIGDDARNDAPASELGIAVYLVRTGAGPVVDHVCGPGRLTTGPWSALPDWLGV